MHVSNAVAVSDQSRPEEARCPGWEVDNLKFSWRSGGIWPLKQEEHRQSKKQYVERKVGIDSRTAASKVTALLQAAIQANKQNGCHPQSIETLSRMFQHLRAGKQDVSVHRSNGKNMPPSRVSASSLQGWLSIASSSDIDAMVAELYA
ncbi:hypothetical protein ABBQ32_007368 [Trebouxia sp. C0010 RCD-2024]